MDQSSGVMKCLANSYFSSFSPLSMKLKCALKDNGIFITVVHMTTC